MDFSDRIRELAARIPRQVAHIQTEEATKNAFVMPFIAAMGYDVFNPLEVTPELHADVGLKKGEKVDYAILKDDKPIAEPSAAPLAGVESEPALGTTKRQQRASRRRCDAIARGRRRDR